jgi:hypothetical protein
LAFVACTCFSSARASEFVIKVNSAGDDRPVYCNAEELVQRTAKISLKRAIELANCRNWPPMTKGQKADVRIELDAGIYRLDSVLEIIWGREPSQGQLTITGPKDGGAVLSGARELKDFQLIDDASIRRRLPLVARDKVLQADLKSVGLIDLRKSAERGFARIKIPAATELFFSGQAMKVATWPDAGWGRTQIPADKQDEALRFGIEGRDISLWSVEPDMTVTGYFGRKWAEESIPVASIDVANNQVLLAAPGPRFGIKDGARVRIENALCELDAPGEWYLDRKAGMVYFWPPRPIQDGTAEVSVVDTLMSIKNSRNVYVSKLQFDMARGDAVTISNGDNVVIVQSVFKNAGSRAVVISGGKDSGVAGVDIDDVGEGGAVLQGGYRRSLQPANLFVVQSRIRHYNRLSSTYRPAVQIEGVGNKVIGNVISDAPHSAIIFAGNDHIIAYNNISRVVQDTDDAGAIYAWRDWTMRGTVVESNFLHDIGKPGASSLIMGIYLDDQISGTVIRKNIFARVQTPILIGGGRDNLVESNLFFHSPPAIQLDARGLTWERNQTIDPAWDLQEKLKAVPYNRPPYSTRYLHLSDILDDDIGAPKYNVFRQNVVIDSEPFQIQKEAQGGILIKGNFYETDEIFLQRMSPDLRLRPVDFVLKDSSRLLKSGFRLPELERIAN